MTKRQTKLYEYLMSRGDQWTTQMEIALALDTYYNAKAFENSKDFHDSSTRFDIAKDIRAISISDECEKIIISSSNGVKIANEEEFYRFMKRQYASLFRKLYRLNKIAKKGGMHNQVEINGQTIEAFLENAGEN